MLPAELVGRPPERFLEAQDGPVPVAVLPCLRRLRTPVCHNRSTL